ncbi:MAG: phenylalanine--tRNA ligase subunit beta [Hyphomicrobiales bacterium]
MKVSLSWLAEYVRIKMSAAELAEALTLVGLAVDAAVDRFGFLDTVRVGRILSVESHPAADRLTLCRVDTGRGVVPIVCGAPNVKVGALAPVALPGTVMPDGTVLTAGIIRGQRSEGMLCSAAELALGVDAGGILLLDGPLTIGTPLNRALGLSDTVLEIDLTPNRADCLSLIGVAREAAAIQRVRLKYPRVTVRDADDRITRLASVSIAAPDHCPRYAARVLEDVTVKPSPFWLQDRLLSVGLRPINNIVDVTNFVMLECGQPLHAFDLDRLAGNRIVVRTAAEGETFATLDQKERVLDAEMLMICDAEKPVAVAGVMGGLNSEIHSETTRVLIESACFDPLSVRKTSKKLGLGTDASRRFERGVDPAGTVLAASRAAQLMAEVSGGRIAGGVIDAHPRPWAPRPIRLSVNRTHRLLGIRVDKKNIRRLLSAIEFKVASTPERDELEVTPPSFRVDITRPEDLMEEVARLSGFDTIPVTFPAMPAGARRPAPGLELRQRIKTVLSGLGFTEVITYSFIHARFCDRLQLPANDPRRGVVAVLNPLAEDQAVMRSSLIPGLLETTRFNLAQQTKRLKIFEIGKVFLQTAGAELPQEPEFIAGLWTGARQPLSWHGKDTPCDFYDLKGAVESLLGALKLEGVRFTRMPDSDCRYIRPGHSARILAEGREIGLIGEIHSRVRAAFDLKQPGFVFELDAGALAALLSETKYHLRIQKFPAVTRDITLIMDQSPEAQQVLDSVGAMKLDLLESVQLVDVFAGGPIPPGKRSLSFRLTYRSPEKTLEDAEVNSLHQVVTDRLLTEFKAALPR